MWERVGQAVVGCTKSRSISVALMAQALAAAGGVGLSNDAKVQLLFTQRYSHVSNM